MSSRQTGKKPELGGAQRTLVLAGLLDAIEAGQYQLAARACCTPSTSHAGVLASPSRGSKRRTPTCLIGCFRAADTPQPKGPAS